MLWNNILLKHHPVQYQIALCSVWFCIHSAHYILQARVILPLISIPFLKVYLLCRRSFIMHDNHLGQHTGSNNSDSGLNFMVWKQELCIGQVPCLFELQIFKTTGLNNVNIASIQHMFVERIIRCMRLEVSPLKISS